jgi:SAM-dependent methyltransferase
LLKKRITHRCPEWERKYVEGKLNRRRPSFPIRYGIALEHLLDVHTHPRRLHSVTELLACADLLADFDVLGRNAAVIGCGPAPVSILELASSGFSSVGIEPVEGAIQQAHVFLGGVAGVYQGAAEAVPLASNSQSLVLLENVLEHVDSVRKSLDECYRILKPGGVLYILTTNRKRFSFTGINWEFSTRFYNWFPRTVKESYVFSALHDRPEIARYSPRPAVHWFSFAELCQHGRDVGFARFYSSLDLRYRCIQNPTRAQRARASLLRNPWVRALCINQCCGEIFMWKRQ